MTPGASTKPVDKSFAIAETNYALRNSLPRGLVGRHMWRDDLTFARGWFGAPLL